MGGVESNFLYQCVPCIKGYNHPDLPAIMVLKEYLGALEVCGRACIFICQGGLVILLLCRVQCGGRSEEWDCLIITGIISVPINKRFNFYLYNFVTHFVVFPAIFRPVIWFLCYSNHLN